MLSYSQLARTGSEVASMACEVDVSVISIFGAIFLASPQAPAFLGQKEWELELLPPISAACSSGSSPLSTEAIWSSPELFQPVIFGFPLSWDNLWPFSYGREESKLWVPPGRLLMHEGQQCL